MSRSLAGNVPDVGARDTGPLLGGEVFAIELHPGVRIVPSAHSQRIGSCRGRRNRVLAAEPVFVAVVEEEGLPNELSFFTLTRKRGLLDAIDLGGILAKPRVLDAIVF